VLSGGVREAVRIESPPNQRMRVEDDHPRRSS
jgi:hypothetical protein